jgi:hypothetical protein
MLAVMKGTVLEDMAASQSEWLRGMSDAPALSSNAVVQVI